MFKELEERINESIKEKNLFVDTIYIEKKEGLNNLNICIDSKKERIDVEKITEITKIINPIVDESDIVSKNDIDVVDIYSKEKGDKKDRR